MDSDVLLMYGNEALYAYDLLKNRSLLFVAQVDERLADVSPTLLIATVIVAMYLAAGIFHFLWKDESTWNRLKRFFFRCVRSLPFVRGHIESKMAETKRLIADGFGKQNKGMDYERKLPSEGLERQQVLVLADKYSNLDPHLWKNGRVSGTVYCGNNELTDLLAEVYKKFMWTNPLHMDVFPSIRKMEAEVVKMCCDIFDGDDESCGTMTSGGTESILMACRAYREYGRVHKSIEKPEIVAPITVHAAFDKAANYFGMRIRHVPVDPVTFKVRVNAMRKVIGRNTVMLVASAPAFPHGVIDDVTAVAALGVRYNIPVHVDCCLGGFLTPFLIRAGLPGPKVGFSVEGVTSVSADTHKYGFSAKGTSVILYSSPKYLRHQIFCQPNWPGGIYASPSISGSRPGALIAATWATLMHFGMDGYIKSTQAIYKTTKLIEKGLRALPGVRVLGVPETSVVAFTTDSVDIYRVSSALGDLEWTLNSLQYPPSIHICVTLPMTRKGVAEAFLRDVKKALSIVLEDPAVYAQSSGVLYGSTAAVPDRNLIEDVGIAYIEGCYSVDNMPDHRKQE